MKKFSYSLLFLTFFSAKIVALKQNFQLSDRLVQLPSKQVLQEALQREGLNDFARLSNIENIFYSAQEGADDTLHFQVIALRVIQSTIEYAVQNPAEFLEFIDPAKGNQAKILKILLQNDPEAFEVLRLSRQYDFLK